MEEKEILAYLVKREDGYHVIDNDGTEGPVCNKVTVDGYIVLSPNAANRKYYNLKNAEAHFDVSEEPIGFTYKETKHFGSVGAKVPNAKLIAYLPENEQAEYMAIIDRARQAMEANKTKPLTEKEKLEAKIAKAQAALAKLIEEAGE